MLKMLAGFINRQVAVRYLRKPELEGFLNFQYPNLAMQFAGFVNELFYLANIPRAPYVNTAGFEVTNHCNLRCEICPHKKGEMRKKGFMDFEMFKKILDSNPHLNMVQLNGWGEPFMHPGIMEFIRYAKSKKKRVYLYSNGTLIDDRLADEILKSALDRIVISIDGVDGIYEEIRGYPYSKIENKVMGLIKKRNDTKSLLAVDISMVGSEKTEKFVNVFKERWEGIADRTQVLSYFEHTPKIHRTRCRELWRGNPQIQWNGDVSVCCVDWSGELVIGRTGPDGYDLRKIWNCRKIKDLRRLHIKKKFHSACNMCNEYSSDHVTARFG